MFIVQILYIFLLTNTGFCVNQFQIQQDHDFLRDLLQLSKINMEEVFFNITEFIGIELKQEDYNVTWMYFPDGQNKIQIALLNKPTKDVERSSLDSIASNVIFQLYTSKTGGNSEIIKFNPSSKALELSIITLNTKLPTKIILHGWMGNTTDPVVQKIKNEYFKQGHFNIIGVDWSRIASNYNYFMVALNVQNVGKLIGKFINSLVTQLKIDPKQIHLIGHSLGAHVCGYAGYYSKFKIARITGLDPAKPLFEGFGPEKRLDTTDATFVDIIHTCGNYFGMSNPIGHVDFYPNGGSPPQPGCFGLLEMITCSHGRAYELYAESIMSEMGFWAYPCDNYSYFELNKCVANPILMGNNVPKNATGVYYFKTRAIEPFAVGVLQVDEKS